MARLRLLFSLAIVTLGAMLGGVAISGYFEPRTRNPQVQAALASVSNPVPPVSSHLTVPQGRLRFVAVAEEKPPVPHAKPKTAAKAPAAKAKPVAKDRPEPRATRPQQAALPWPWSLFSN